MATSKVWEYESVTNDALAKKVDKNATIVMTSPLMALDVISLIPLIDDDVMIEPCKGTGSFHNSFPKHVINMFCEINEGIDYLDFNGEVGSTMSNPPFVPRILFWSFQCKAMETTRNTIYWLINVCSLNVFTAKRLNGMNSKGWYINDCHIVSDKRWFGRYVWMRISRTNTQTITWCDKAYECKNKHI